MRRAATIAFLVLAGCREGCTCGASEVGAGSSGESSTGTMATSTGAVDDATHDAAAEEEQPPALLSPGAEPRELLRLRAALGTEQVLEVSNQVSIDVRNLPGQPAAIRSPVMTTRMNVRVTTASEDLLGYEFVTTDIALADPNSDPAHLRALEQAFGIMVGSRTEILADRHGVIREVEFVHPDGIAPELRQNVDAFEAAIKELAIPFPDAPVGIGARWRTVRSGLFGGLAIERVVTYQLLARDGDRITLSITGDGSAEPQVLPGMPPGARASIEWLDFQAEGSAQFDLSRAVPETRINLGSEMKSSYEAAGNRFVSVVKTQATVVSRVIDPAAEKSQKKPRPRPHRPPP